QALRPKHLPRRIESSHEDILATRGLKRTRAEIDGEIERADHHRRSIRERRDPRGRLGKLGPKASTIDMVASGVEPHDVRLIAVVRTGELAAAKAELAIISTRDNRPARSDRRQARRLRITRAPKSTNPDRAELIIRLRDIAAATSEQRTKDQEEDRR